MKDEVLQTAQRIAAARKRAGEAVGHYRQTMENQSSSRDEIKAACNAAITAWAELADLQTEYTNELITAGQIMREQISGAPPRLKS